MAKEFDLAKHAKALAGGTKGDKGQLLRAATVIVLRDCADGLETLMLRKNSKIAFGGMWVFPGGRIDDADAGSDEVAQARSAAAREAMEEASIEVDPDSLVWFSHWTPPALEIRRFATWFFAVETKSRDVRIDDGEITESAWMSPSDALARRDAREIEVAPPTWVTLHYLSRYTSAREALGELGELPPRFYVTKACPVDGGLDLLWQGDAGYEAADPSIDGPRHRLRLSRSGYEFDDSGAQRPA